MFFLPAFITLSKDYYQCERLASPRHRRLNLPETRRISQCWQNVGHSAGPALIGQTGEKKNLEYAEEQTVGLNTCHPRLF